jgi:DNA (cytosine-5)-methyltransferase 1
VLNGLDLFSGIGGISIALNPWVRPVAYCECDRYCQGVLLSRMQSGDIASAPINDDVRDITGRMFQYARPEIIYGGFPCQDISVAGTGTGLEGKRSGLFFEIVRITSELRPRFVFLENVPAITTRGGVRVITEFARLGYDCRWTIVSAAEIGAPHLRRRWFLLAYAGNSGQRELLQQEQELWSDETPDTRGYGEIQSVANATAKGMEGQGLSGHGSWWATEPDVGRVAHGVPARVDRIRGLGNAVVPIQAQTAFKRLLGL